MNKAIKLGEVVLLDPEIDFEKGLYPIVKKIRFGGETKQLGLIVGDEAMSSIAEDIIYAVLYTANEEQLRAYYRQDDFLYLLDSSQSFNAYFVYRQLLEDPDDELSLISAIDAHFGGHGHLHIEMTPAELRSTYGRNQNIAKFAILGVVVLAFLALVIPELTKEEPTVVPAQPPPPLVLDESQIILLKDALSKKLADKILADAKMISADPSLAKHKKIKSFVVGQMDQGTGESGQYPPMIAKGEIVYEYDFPANGSENSGNDLYVQNVSIDETMHVEDLAPIGKKLSQECFSAIHTITEVKNISVGSRNDNEIVYDFKDIKPADFLRKYIFAADICPVYIRSLNGVDDAYSGTLVLYKEPAKAQP